ITSKAISAPAFSSALRCAAASSAKSRSASCRTRLRMRADSPRAAAVLFNCREGRRFPAPAALDRGGGRRLAATPGGGRRLAAPPAGPEPLAPVAAHVLDQRQQSPALVGELVLDA